MYSNEIKQVMEQYNYSITSSMYFNICDNSPQIDHIRYSPYDDKIEMWSMDGGYWKFGVTTN